MVKPGGQNNRRAIASWCLYDWANSAFNTLVVTFIYSTFFGETFADDPGHGMALWSRGIAISALFIAVLAPIAGTLADRGDRRRYLIGCTLTCVAMTGALAFVQPGQANAAIVALAGRSGLLQCLPAKHCAVGSDRTRIGLWLGSWLCWRPRVPRARPALRHR